MTRHSLFNFARKGDLFVPADEPEAPKGRAQVGYSRRFFMGALAAGVYSGAGVRRFQSLYAYRVGIDRSYGEEETVFMRSVCPGNWREVTGHYTVNPAGVYTFNWPAGLTGTLPLTPRTLDYPPTAHLPWNPRT